MFQATPRFDLDGLLALMPGEQFNWMKQRASHAWNDWVHAGRYFEKRYQKYKKKKVIVYPI